MNNDTAQIAKFMRPTWGHLGPVGSRWAPCWPHEPCYQGFYMQLFVRVLIPMLVQLIFVCEKDQNQTKQNQNKTKQSKKTPKKLGGLGTHRFFIYFFFFQIFWVPFHNLRLISIPAWIRNYIHYKVCGETYLPNINGVTVGVWEWINNFLSHFVGQVITSPCWD